MNGWDLALLAVAGYVAAMGLVRMMIRRRDQMLDEFHQRMEAERKKSRDPRRRHLELKAGQRPEQQAEQQSEAA